MCVERQEWSGNGVDDMRGFGIIREAALFQGHGPATIAKFLELWAANGFGKIATPEPIRRQQPSLFPPFD
jgi:hypothetical protein